MFYSLRVVTFQSKILLKKLLNIFDESSGEWASILASLKKKLWIIEDDDDPRNFILPWLFYEGFDCLVPVEASTQHFYISSF